MGELGVYGLRIAGLDEAGDLLSATEPSWPALQIDVRVATVDGRLPYGLTESALVAPLGDDGSLEVRHVDGRWRARFVVPHALPDRHLAHPYLSLPAAAVSRWTGRETFHAGAAVIGGRAWGIGGSAGMGKTSTLAWLHRQGTAVLTDDLLVLDGAVAFAGPRCMDLRKEPAARFGMGEAIGVVGSRERWRVPLGTVPGHVPFAGLIHLAWSPTVSLTPLSPAERLRRLFECDALQVGPQHPEAYLRLAALPGWVFARPRDLGCLDDSCATLLEALTEASSHR